jgi:hypothetical protein
MLLVDLVAYFCFLILFTMLQLYCIHKQFPLVSFQLGFMILSVYCYLWFPSTVDILLILNFYGIYNIFIMDIENF